MREYIAENLTVIRKYFKKRRFRPSFSEGKTRSMNIVLPYYLPKIEA